jgi:hypothetical protein
VVDERLRHDMASVVDPNEQRFLDYNDSKWEYVMGPMYLGTGLDMLCLGVICCQAIFWKVRLERDERWPLRALVVSVKVSPCPLSFKIPPKAWLILQYWVTLGSIAHTAL